MTSKIPTKYSIQQTFIWFFVQAHRGVTSSVDLIPLWIFFAYHRTAVTKVTFTSVFKDNKLLILSYKTVEIYVFPKISHVADPDPQHYIYLVIYLYVG